MEGDEENEKDEKKSAGVRLPLRDDGGGGVEGKKGIRHNYDRSKTSATSRNWAHETT